MEHSFCCTLPATNGIFSGMEGCHLLGGSPAACTMNRLSHLPGRRKHMGYSCWDPAFTTVTHAACGYCACATCCLLPGRCLGGLLYNIYCLPAHIKVHILLYSIYIYIDMGILLIYYAYCTIDIDFLEQTLCTMPFSSLLWNSTFCHRHHCTIYILSHLHAMMYIFSTLFWKWDSLHSF